MRPKPFFVVVFIAVSALASQAPSRQMQLTPAMETIQRRLIERAGFLLERYGTTFYALGFYITADGKLREVVPLESAPLKPALVAESLRSAVREIYASKASAIGIALDFPEKAAVQIELEDMSGLCRRVRRSYRFEQSGRVVFLSPEISDCAPSIFSQDAMR